VTRLKGFLFAFMMARGIKKLEGEKSDIGMQRNSTASLIVDDPLQIAEHFFERNVRSIKTELQEIVYQLAEGDVRRRLELTLKDGWELNGEAVRAALVNQEAVAGARLVTGSHVRIR
jgi:Siphovirus Gp157